MLWYAIVAGWTRSTSPAGSSASPPSTTSSSCRSRSACRSWSPACRRPGCRTGNERWLRLTKFFGKLFLINFAMGVVTGIVQEFQFGMNWSDYSRFVGDVFGAPLAIEALLAFFLESTFLGLWIFGWDRLPKRLHLASIWVAAIGTVLSARTSSWPPTRGCRTRSAYRFNPDTGRAELHRLRRGADQQGRPGHLPAHHRRRVPDRRRAGRRRRAVAPGPPAAGTDTARLPQRR